ncbi:hypothetical protein SAMN05421819_3939 [Bryocella elongata]|uniref:Outer membrane protein beta-barrel domain-containing protein n=1 Tax=Bryocella elongata TaxID=863522 RepID=A0A1H6BQR0_9BACT|nr:hypothetical protein [Bryocella elongata]SEG63033.1 hypothetical protein SAMN05421819_3939 [Bryocella elongata]
MQMAVAGGLRNSRFSSFRSSTYRLLSAAAAILAAASFASGRSASAQAHATAERDARISVFGGFTGSFTDLDNGRNMSVTAGGDFSLMKLFGLTPSIEVRGTYPINDGQVVAVKDILGGIKLEKKVHFVRPYGDFLFGRGAMDYHDLTLNRDGTLYYYRSYSNVWAAGVGFDFLLSPSWALKLDGQMERFNSPITNSGDQWVKAGTIGVKYTIPFRGTRYGH